MFVSCASISLQPDCHQLLINPVSMSVRVCVSLWPTNKLGFKTCLTFDLPLARSEALTSDWLLIKTHLTSDLPLIILAV